MKKIITLTMLLASLVSINAYANTNSTNKANFSNKQTQTNKIMSLEEIKSDKINEEIANYENKDYVYSEFLFKYNKPLNLKYSVVSCINGKFYKRDPLLIKQKLSTHLGSLINFSDKKPRGVLEVYYSVTKGDSVKVANPIIGEYKFNENKIRIDIKYKDFKHNKIIKDYVEGSVSNLSELLNDLSLEIIRGINIIDDNAKEKKKLYVK